MSLLRALGLRWPLFAATVVLFIWNLFSLTWESLAAFVVCGSLWLFLSQRKMMGLDKSTRER